MKINLKFTTNAIFILLTLCSLCIFSSCGNGKPKKEILEQTPEPTEDQVQTEEEEEEEEEEETNNSDSQESNTNASDDATKYPTVLGLANGQTISSGQKIEINSQGLWFAFEGELGTVRLLDEQGNELGLGILSTEENWMVQGPVIFNTILNYKSTQSGKGTLVFKNNNPSDNRELDQSFSLDVHYSKN